MESLIIQRKYSAKAVRALSPIELEATCKALGIRIAIITGWQLPEPAHQRIFWEQLAKYLLEQYPTLNHEEIEYAFRTKSSNVKDWGKSMNLSLFTEVLDPYTTERKAASIIEAQEAAKIESQAKELPMAEMSDDERIETAFQIWKHNKNWEFIFQGTYQSLFNIKKIQLSEDDRAAYMAAAKAIANQKEDKDREYFSQLNKPEWLKNTARKLAVAKYFVGLFTLESK